MTQYFPDAPFAWRIFAISAGDRRDGEIFSTNARIQMLKVGQLAGEIRATFGPRKNLPVAALAIREDKTLNDALHVLTEDL